MNLLKRWNDAQKELSETKRQLRELRKKHNYLLASHTKLKQDLSVSRHNACRDRQLASEATTARQMWRDKYETLRTKVKELL